MANKLKPNVCSCSDERGIYLCFAFRAQISDFPTLNEKGEIFVCTNNTVFEKN